MITRIRVTGVRPGTLAESKGIARDWNDLLGSHGGRVLGFYLDEAENEITGAAEYESRESLAEILRAREADPAFASIQSPSGGTATSFEESIVDKLEIDPSR